MYSIELFSDIFLISAGRSTPSKPLYCPGILVQNRSRTSVYEDRCNNCMQVLSVDRLYEFLTE